MDMRYVYQLSIKDEIIYIGMTSYPAIRYMQHYGCSNNSPCNRMRYELSKGIVTNMNLLFYGCKNDAFKLEDTLIRQGIKDNPVLLNIHYRHRMNKPQFKIVSYNDYKQYDNLRSIEIIRIRNQQNKFL